MTQKLKTTVKTEAKAKKFQLFVGTELKAESNFYQDALKELSDLQKINFAQIKFVNHEAKVTHLYSKDRYDKNYRITGAEYVAPSKIVDVVPL